MIDDSGNNAYHTRILIGTPVTGLVRIEWVQARYGQIIPVNWSNVQMLEGLDGYYPLRYQVADAQNLICQLCVEHDFEWVLFLEHDTCLPEDGFIRLDAYMREATIPVVSGLYYTRSRPSEPLVFRGRGNSFYGNWKMGDLVWCDGVPTGCLLVSGKLIKAIWDESAEYQISRPGYASRVTRRVFDTPRNMWFDPESGVYNAVTGTSDLAWCDRVMKGGYFEKAGWKAYQKKKYPFLIDTGIFCKHIDQDGTIFP